MQKPLKPQTTRELNPPANVASPYGFFEAVQDHPLQPLDTALNLRNAWWMADAALLSYSSPAAIEKALADAGLQATVVHFDGASTQAYVVSLPDAIVVAFRGTQLDNFFSAVIDFLMDARFLPVPDPNGHLVHAGFNAALNEVWTTLEAHLRGLQAAQARPLWVTGHSLGAALATLAAGRLSGRPEFRLQGGYTFGSPRVASREFAEALQVPLYRFRNDTDVVPHLPIGLVFDHVGHLEFIDGGGHLHQDVPADAEEGLDLPRGMLLAGGFIRRQTNFDLPVVGFIADHAPVNYSVLVWNCYDAAGSNDVTK